MTDISKRRKYSQIVPVIRFDTPPVLEYGMKITKDLLDASITGLILTDIHGNSNTTDVLLENMQLSQKVMSQLSLKIITLILLIIRVVN